MAVAELVDELNAMGLREEPGWLGMFTREQAEGAIANGTLIEKRVYETGDAHAVGAVGVVIGSLRALWPVNSSGGLVQHFYFVEWQARPRVAVGVADYKIRVRQHDG